MSSNELPIDWVANFLKDLSEDIDADVVGEYICGIINVSHGSSESHSEIAELLSAYLPSEQSKNAATKIISEYDRIILQKNKVELSPSSSSSLSTNMIESVENQMRHLIQADCMRIVEMKKSNHLLLPDQQQQQQQQHSSEEYELEGAMMHNHTELMPKTRFNPIGVDASNSIEIGGGDGVGVDVDDAEDESDSDHLEDIENICGYGKK
ncbi:unnamed protein product [Schistosoma turkestanicum]|nr:unnamed protein product [Schistosoma turkestanicum]CAH8551122.1 unnamed protein product [Schistosoma turkestanicum]